MLTQLKGRLIQQKDEFQRDLKNFLSQSDDNEAKNVFSKRLIWRDVKEEAEQALQQYQKEGKSWRHPFQTSGRAFGDVTSRLEFLLELLPRGEYTSLLFGGLALAFNVCNEILRFDVGWHSSSIGSQADESNQRVDLKDF